MPSPELAEELSDRADIMQTELDKDLERIAIRGSIVGSYSYKWNPGGNWCAYKDRNITLHDDGSFSYQTSDHNNPAGDSYAANSSFKGTWELEPPNTVKILTCSDADTCGDVNGLEFLLPSSALTWTPDRTLTWVEPTQDSFINGNGDGEPFTMVAH